MTHLISIIFPTLNEESVIGESILLLKSKLTLPHEVIVSDGKSRDHTVEIAKKYADRVIEYSGTNRQNISQGRNAGGRAAQGDFVIFMDADSRIENPDDFFKTALDVFEHDSHLVAMTVRLRVYPKDETPADRIIFGLLNFNLRLMNNIIHHGESTGEFQMIRKTAFDKLGGFREDLITREDADMFLRLSRIGRTYANPNLTVFHSGRRAHKVGWPRLLWSWMSNTIWVMIFDRAHTKEWKEVR